MVDLVDVVLVEGPDRCRYLATWHPFEGRWGVCPYSAPYLRVIPSKWWMDNSVDRNWGWRTMSCSTPELKETFKALAAGKAVQGWDGHSGI